ncbi:hemolysin III family protein [Candidatus Neomarinimicrobiota bacterium]
MHTDSHKSKRLYTLGEEIANAVIHGLGAALSVVGMIMLVLYSARLGDTVRVVSFAIFGTTLIALYLSSTLYHSIQHAGAKRILREIDHATIYLLIAGSYTPILLIPLRGPWGWTLLPLIWGLAILGIIYQIFSTKSKGKFGLVTYLLMGWLCVVALHQMIINIPAGGLYWLFAGGLFYSVGTIFYGWHKLLYHHAIWHLFVLAGSASHFISMWLYVLPKG